MGEDQKQPNVSLRFLAKFVDFLISMIFSYPLFLIFDPLGIVASVGYLLLCDGILEGRSPGKKMVRLKVIHIPTGAPCSYRQSAIRNLPMGIFAATATLPWFSWLFLLVLGIPLLALEAYFTCSLENGMRLGDVLADTRVAIVEDK